MSTKVLLKSPEYVSRWAAWPEDCELRFSHPGDPDHPDTPAEERLAEAEAEAFPEEEGEQIVQ